MKLIKCAGIVIAFILQVSLVQQVAAELRIEVTEGLDDAVKVAVVPFVWEGRSPLPENLSEIIDADLRLSGRFETTPVDQMLSLPASASEVFPRDWKLLQVEYIIIGRIQAQSDRIQLRFELFNVPRQAVDITQTIEGSIDELRDMAHYASDVIFENLTGIEGAFSTRIMYVTATGPLDDRSFQLNIADADGHRIKTVLQSREPILSATWAPDGNRIAYQSFEKDSRPAIYIADLTTGARQQITDFEGLNGAPAFSPDGKSLAMVLSKDGSPDIYVLDIETRRLRRITRHYGIDTEPSWTPDGKAIIFTSSRGGKPQIYQMTLRDLSIERLTFEGDYNAKASILPDGSGIIMVHRREGIYHIALFDMNRGRISILTETSLDESPSIAPNGSMLIYATQVNNSGILAAVSVDSRVKFNLPSSEGDVREPAWSPKKRMTFTPISQ